ncbi:hypothetical protein OSTOST_08681 [Ostertagia ostertagi]
MQVLEKCWAAFRFCTLRPIHEDELDRKLHGEHAERKDYRLHNVERLLAIPVTVAIMAVVGWTCVGCFIVHFYMPDHDTTATFYFIFNSLATIGRQNQLDTAHTIASFDSYEELGISSDCPLNHFATLGILQTDDKCPLLGIARREFAYMDAITQTEKTVPHGYQATPPPPSPSAVLLPYPHTSHEDVNSLIVETYGVKPARQISYPRK